MIFKKLYFEFFAIVYLEKIHGKRWVAPLRNDFETKHMPELIKLGVLFWVRFVDDIFAVIKSREQAEKILEFLNSQHKTIKFTIEKEVNNSINFLDVKITKNSDNSISTSTYIVNQHRKPTFVNQHSLV